LGSDDEPLAESGQLVFDGEILGSRQIPVGKTFQQGLSGHIFVSLFRLKGLRPSLLDFWLGLVESLLVGQSGVLPAATGNNPNPHASR
jgi:hypothetical protein